MAWDSKWKKLAASAKKLKLGHGWIFQLDNDLKYTSKSTQAYNINHIISNQSSLKSWQRCDGTQTALFLELKVKTNSVISYRPSSLGLADLLVMFLSTTVHRMSFYVFDVHKVQIWDLDWLRVDMFMTFIIFSENAKSSDAKPCATLAVIKEAWPCHAVPLEPRTPLCWNAERWSRQPRCIIWEYDHSVSPKWHWISLFFNIWWVGKWAIKTRPGLKVCLIDTVWHIVYLQNRQKYNKTSHVRLHFVPFL